MLKTTFILILIVNSFLGFSQIQAIPKTQENQKVNTNLKATSNTATFNNLKHPLSIIGDLLVLGGAGTYVVGSEINNSRYSPENKTQYIGIAAFATGAVLFTIFSTERNNNAPKRKKTKKVYQPSDWEIAAQ